MKSLILLLAIAFSLTSQASPRDKQTQELLETLIANSATITVINETDGSKGENLAAILASALLATKNADGQVVVTIDSDCKSTTNGRVGASSMSCTLNINNADYSNTREGLAGPNLESSFILKFDTVKAVVPKAKLKIQNNVVTFNIAG